MESEQTQPSLLSRLRDPADTAAWREFDARYRELIFRFCRARGLQAADAEDVRQAIMIRLSRSMREFEYQPERGRFRSYLGRVVRNSVLEHLARPNRAAQPLDTIVQATEPANDEGQAEEIWEREWREHHLRLAMQTIRATFDPRSVQVFDRLLDGVPVERLAADFAMSEQAIYKVKQRIRDRMKQLVEKQIREEDEPF